MAYYYRIATVNSNGTGPLSTEINATPSATWSQQAYVKAVNNDSGDYFGEPVINKDTLIVGTFLESSNQTNITNGSTASSNNSNSNSGALYVYKRTGTTWEQEAYIKASNSEAGDWFAWGNAISLDNHTIAVAAVWEDSNQKTITNGSTSSSNNDNQTSGAVYVYKRTGINWSQEAYIKASNSKAGDQFGFSLALSGETLAVGHPYDDSNQTSITNGTSSSSDVSTGNSGAVFVYKRTGSNWSREAYIKPVVNTASYSFGYQLDLDNDTLVVGAYWDGSSQTTITNGSTASNDTSKPYSGAVYVYRRSGTSWAQEAYIKAVNGLTRHFFGMNAIAISGDTIAVGVKEESSNQNYITNGQTASNDNSSEKSGAVYIYKRTGTNWSQEAYIKPTNSDSGDEFGVTLDLDGDFLVVGAHKEDSDQKTITNSSSASTNNSRIDSGAVYIFHRIGITWTQEAYIKAINSDVSDGFGGNVSIDNNTIAVRSSYESSPQTTITNGSTASTDNSNSLNSGAVFVYKVE